ncbi:Hypothetical predicted protein [Olea europaea subsp. europaea]|uniref:Uncharacterized protein n=1 Tax=Olea europaea subsp. europaea TaxID=158383 RepID=A0A8S0R8H0_OLEEU|nr:Hypothetical predicted protein [Olea europaea subsp. europaea]
MYTNLDACDFLLGRDEGVKVEKEIGESSTINEAIGESSTIDEAIGESTTIDKVIDESTTVEDLPSMFESLGRIGKKRNLEISFNLTLRKCKEPSKDNGKGKGSAK